MQAVIRHDELPLDDLGRLDGFSLGGKARNLAEWREQREEREFRRLCRRVYQANYQRRYYHAVPGVRTRSILRSTARRRASAPVRRCRNCAAEWVNVPGLCPQAGRPPTLYCSARCRRQWHNRALAAQRKAARRGVSA